jgi:hypothetical protein
MQVAGARRTASGQAALVVELVCLALSPPLLLWAAVVLSNLVGTPDSAGVVYVTFALVVASPSVLMLAVTVGLRTRGRVTGWTARLRAVTATEWLIGAVVLAMATIGWLLTLPWQWHF